MICFNPFFGIRGAPWGLIVPYYTYEHDALERRTGVIDPRKGKSITHYNDKNQVDHTEDPGSNRLCYGYDLHTGRKIMETDAAGHTTHYA